MLYQAWDAGSFELATSRAQLGELERVFAYDKLRPCIARDEAEALLEMIGSAAFVMEELPAIDLSPDPDDNVILATATVGEAASRWMDPPPFS